MDMSRSVFVSVAVVVLTLSPSTAGAVWGPDSVLTLGGSTHYGLAWGAIVPAGAGDVYAIWHWGPSSPYASGVSRVTAEGALVFTSYQDSRTYPQGVALDGTGGVIEAFPSSTDPYTYTNPDIAFRRTTPAGAMEPPNWPPYWAHQAAPSSNEMYPAVATDPAGGAYIAWIRPTLGPYILQRVTTAGTIAPGWSTAGRPIGPPDGIFPPGSPPTLLPDGSGGVLMLACLGRNGTPTDSVFMRAWRVHPDGTLASGWPINGVALGTAADQYAGEDDDLALVPGPAGHTFAVWITATATSRRVVYCSFDGAGNLDVPVLGLGPLPGSSTRLAAQSDGQDGMLVTWLQEGTLEIAHVLANGAVGAGPIAVAAGAGGRGVATGRNGGFLVFWGDYTGLWGKWYQAYGTPDPNVPGNPRLVRSVPSHPDVFPVAAYTDGDGGAYALFDEVGAYSSAVRMMHVLPSVVLDAGPPPRASGLALTVAPNPARGELRLAMTLPGEQAASIDLLDVAGRRWLTRTLPAGASEREERIALPSGLPSGVYLVSLRQGSRAAMRRVAIIQ
jgi:hypothetical protein